MTTFFMLQNMHFHSNKSANYYRFRIDYSHSMDKAGEVIQTTNSGGGNDKWSRIKHFMCTSPPRSISVYEKKAAAAAAKKNLQGKLFSTRNRNLFFFVLSYVLSAVFVTASQ